MFTVIPQDAKINLQMLGGKAYHLWTAAGRLTSLIKPDSLVITTELFDDMKRVAKIDQLIEEMNAASGEDEERLRGLIVGRIREYSIPSYIVGIKAALDAHGLHVVRSSSVDEDHEDHSFAGMHDSFMGVTANSAEEMIKECWASLYSSRAIAYRKHLGLGISDAKMAVLIQQQLGIEKDGWSFYAGTAFSRDPVGLSPGSIIEVVAGLGETLVSGSVTPLYTIISSNNSYRVVTRGDQEYMTMCTSDGKVVRRDKIYDDLSGKNLNHMINIINHWLQRSRELGEVDIEWAVDIQEPWVVLHLLQARPLFVTDGLSNRVEPNSNRMMIGLSASPGVFEGPYSNNYDGEEVPCGKTHALISEHTTPNMLPSMLRAGAIATRIGGITCHAAIVGRELKIPVVVGVDQISMVTRSSDGNRIVIDGNRGTVWFPGTETQLHP